MAVLYSGKVIAHDYDITILEKLLEVNNMSELDKLRSMLNKEKIEYKNKK